MEHHHDEQKGFFETLTGSDGAGGFAVFYITLALIWIACVVIFG